MSKSRPRTLATYFIQGFLSLLPLMVTVYIASLLFAFIERLLDNVLVLLPPAYRHMKWAVIAAEATAVATFVTAITAFGFVVHTLVGRSLVRAVDNIFDGLPGLSVIYRTTKQVVELLARKRESFLTRPVLVQYPSPGRWAIGFDTGQVPRGMQPADSSERHFTVFIPTTPNPTSGVMAVIPERDIRPIQMSVEEVVKMILTGGVVKSGLPGGVSVGAERETAAAHIASGTADPRDTPPLPQREPQV